jgi:hypothetical protein
MHVPDLMSSGERMTAEAQIALENKMDGFAHGFPTIAGPRLEQAGNGFACGALRVGPEVWREATFVVRWPEVTEIYA